MMLLLFTMFTSPWTPQRPEGDGIEDEIAEETVEETILLEEVGTSEEVLGASEEELGASEEVLAISEEVLGASEEELGAPEDMLGIPDEVLGVSEEELGAPEDVLGTPDEVLGSSELVVDDENVGVSEGVLEELLLDVVERELGVAEDVLGGVDPGELEGDSEVDGGLELVVAGDVEDEVLLDEDLEALVLETGRLGHPRSKKVFVLKRFRIKFSALAFSVSDHVVLVATWSRSAEYLQWSCVVRAYCSTIRVALAQIILQTVRAA